MGTNSPRVFRVLVSGRQLGCDVELGLGHAEPEEDQEEKNHRYSRCGDGDRPDRFGLPLCEQRDETSTPGRVPEESQANPYCAHNVPERT